MSTPTPETNVAGPPRVAMPLTIDIALIRWSVVCGTWDDMSSGHAPNLQAFLAGWCCRVIGATMPICLGTMRDSFRVGWREADQQVEIAAREIRSGRIVKEEE